MKEKVPHKIRIRVNEKEVSVPAHFTLFQIKNQFKPNADVIIYNGFPLASDYPLKQGDEIVFILKGEIIP